MKIVSYHPHAADHVPGPGTSARTRLGVLTAAGMLDIAAAAERQGLPDPSRDAASFFDAGLDRVDSLAELVGLATDGPFVDGARLAPTVPAPGKILCVGLNYRRHAAESGMAEPKEPVLFSKFNNALAAHGDDVDIAGLQRVDYEAELGVVIGRSAKNIGEGRALEHVLGYLNANDVSERGLQMRSGQWLLGKSLDGFLPLGPQLVTADEAGDPQSFGVRGWLNGDLRQDSTTADMIFSVAEIIAYASRFMTLQPGDVILTGTPAGVVLGRPQQDWVVAGDRFAVEVGPLGRLENAFV